MLDISLTPNARILYFLIDDHAGTGEMWWHWRKLAALIGVGRGRYFELIDELLKADRLSIRRDHRKVFYSVRKIGPESKSQSEKSDRSVRKIGPEYLNMNLPTESGPLSLREETQTPDCPRCYGLGYVLVRVVVRGMGSQERRTCACVAQRRSA